MAKKDKKEKKEFSKVLLIQESALVWIVTLIVLAITAYCVYVGYLGSLPWLAGLITVVWAAYGVSQVYYYKKSTAENTRDGIKFETVLEEVRQAYGKSPQADWTVSSVPVMQVQSNGSNPSGVKVGQSQQVDLDYGI